MRAFFRFGLPVARFGGNRGGLERARPKMASAFLLDPAAPQNAMALKPWHRGKKKKQRELFFAEPQ